MKIVTGRSPLDPMFKEGRNHHNFAQKSLPEHVMQIVDAVLLRNIGINDQVVQAVASSRNGSKKAGYNTRIEVFHCHCEDWAGMHIGVRQERLDINRVIHELHSVRRILHEAQNGSKNL